MFHEHPDIVFPFLWVHINLLWSFQIIVKVVRTFITRWYELRKMQIRYLYIQKTSPTFACNFYSWKNIVYTFLVLIMLIALITSGSLKGAFVLNGNDMHIKVVFISIFWYLICIFSEFICISYEFSKFWSNGQRAFEGSRQKK